MGMIMRGQMSYCQCCFRRTALLRLLCFPKASGQAGEPEFPQESRRSSRQEQNVVNYLTENTDKAAVLCQKDNLKFDPRSFLLLEGPPGSFFRELGWRLRSLGYDTSFLNLSGGDALERLSFLSLLRAFVPAGSLRESLTRGKRIPENKIFRETPDKLPSFLRSFIRERAVTDLLLYDRGLPWHQTVRRVAQECGIRLWVFTDTAEFPGALLLDAVLPDGSARLERLLADEMRAIAGSPESAGKELTAADMAALLRAPQDFRRQETLRRRIGNILLAPFFSCSSDNSSAPRPDDSVRKDAPEEDSGASGRNLYSA